MTIFTSLALIALAAGVHATFQLSVSMVTLLSGHALGKRTRHLKLVRSVNSFLAGASVMTLLLLSTTTLFVSHLFPTATPQLVWSVVCGLLVGVGVAVWAFYYRPGRASALWVPRGMAKYLRQRAEKTTMSAEAFGLGLSSVLAEVLFIAAPILTASLLIVRLPHYWAILGLVIYVSVAMATLIVVTALIGSGHRLSTIQRWREHNRRFLQFVGGAGLLVLGFYLYVNQVLPAHVTALSGALQ